MLWENQTQGGQTQWKEMATEVALGAMGRAAQGHQDTLQNDTLNNVVQ